MIQITKPQQDIIRVLGEQEYCYDVNYKPILYMTKVKVADGELWHNILTKETLLFSLAEVDTISEKTEHLVKKWFYIPQYIEDFSLFYTFLNEYRGRNKRATYGKIKLCTVLPTTGCNARCAYCFEAGAKVRSMSIETAGYLADWLAPRAADHVLMKWFGGEPLCNIPAITTICTALKNNGVHFSSFIVTNGYNIDLVDDNTLLNVWNTTRVQVTLDGRKDVYNQTKNYKCAGDNPYEHVIKNIHRMLSIGITVSVRYNLSGNNLDELMKLSEELADEFKGERSFRVYIHPLFENVGGIGTYSADERGNIYKDYKEIQKCCDELGLSGKNRIRRMPTVHCMADDGRSVVVLPGGELGLCEHHLDDEIYGSIYDDKYDKAVLSSWLEKLPDCEDCLSCPLRPTCYRIRKCPVELICNDELRDYRMYRLHSAILNHYAEWKKENKND